MYGKSVSEFKKKNPSDTGILETIVELEKYNF